MSDQLASPIYGTFFNSGHVTHRCEDHICRRWHAMQWYDGDASYHGLHARHTTIIIEDTKGLMSLFIMTLDATNGCSTTLVAALHYDHKALDALKSSMYSCDSTCSGCLDLILTFFIQKTLSYIYIYMIFLILKRKNTCLCTSGPN
jgi:hypothetical protein